MQTKSFPRTCAGCGKPRGSGYHHAPDCPERGIRTSPTGATIPYHERKRRGKMGNRMRRIPPEFNTALLLLREVKALGRLEAAEEALRRVINSTNRHGY